MWSSIRPVLGLAWLVVMAGTAPAHFNMLLPQKAQGKRGEPVTILYQWGHPFEHQLFDAPAPEGLVIFSPEGKEVRLDESRKTIAIQTSDKKSVTAHEFRFTPSQRGDYLLVLKCPSIWMEEEQEFLQDVVKTVVHVQSQKGWDRLAGVEFELVPLTRPYGLQPGLVFQAQALVGGKPLAGAMVEIERYNSVALKEEDLPPDEHRTRSAKTDPNGVVTFTLPEPGWWCLAAQRLNGKKEHNGKECPVRQRATFLVYVDEEVKRKK